MQDIKDDILLRASEGDMDAFEKVYNAFSDFVYNIAYRITSNREDAQEVAQDVFLKIYRNLKSFRFRSSFKTWVYRITVNTAINAYKKRSRYLAHRTDYNDDINVESIHNTANDAIEKESNSELINSMLGILNTDQRTCIILRDIEGLSYKEIAKALRININTVRSRLKRAREALLTFRQRGGKRQ